MIPVSLTLAANEVRELACSGEFFELRTVASPLTSVELNDRSGGVVGKMESAEQTDKVRARRAFETVRITNGATPQTIRFYYGTGESGSNRFAGDVRVTNTAGVFAQTAPAVTNVSAQVLAANAARRYLLIQNNDAAGVLYVRLDGAAATAANGIKIGPGGSMELQGYVPSGAVVAIGSIANNPNVIVVEG